jgi:5-methylthioribose kinase
MHHAYVPSSSSSGNDDKQRRKEVLDALQQFIVSVWSEYEIVYNQSNANKKDLQSILSDSLGFAACEVGRTALGFAGGRVWLQFEDPELKQRALKKTVEMALSLMNNRDQGLGGVSMFFDSVR